MTSALTNAPALSILLGALLVGLILGNAVWLGILAEAPRLPCLVIGTALVFIGARFTLQGLAGFRRSGTHVLPYKPALALVTDGIFARTRNLPAAGQLAGPPGGRWGESRGPPIPIDQRTNGQGRISQ